MPKTRFIPTEHTSVKRPAELGEAHHYVAVGPRRYEVLEDVKPSDALAEMAEGRQTFESTSEKTRAMILLDFSPREERRLKLLVLSGRDTPTTVTVRERTVVGVK